MTPRSTFELHPGATEDITEIWEHIAEHSPEAAGRVREELLDAMRKLVLFPNQGYQRPDLTRRQLRFHSVRQYVIAYSQISNPYLCSL